MSRTARVILSTVVAVAVLVPLVGDVAEAAPSQGATTTTETTVTVRQGDSLAGIAWRHSVRLSALLRANSLQISSIIHPGQTLVIPAGAAVQTSTAAAVTSTNPTAAPAATAPVSAAGSDYVVRPGDALSGIAWRHGVSLGALVKANNMTVTSLILPGRQLKIPPATRPIPTTVASSGSATATTTSAAIAPAGAVRPAQTSTPASQGSSLEVLLSYATAQVGVPYQFFSDGPETFDCSGLVVAAFRQIGVSVPHQSRALARLGSPVDWRNAPISAGDLVFTSAVGDPALITHVGIALDSRRWVHAVGFGRTVSITALPSNDRIMAVQRITLP